MSRRVLPFILLTTMTVTLMLGCAGPAPAPVPSVPETPAQVPPAPTKPAAPTQVPQAPSVYHEAPMLAELVKAGKLPPVEERLPENPKVVQVVDQIGKYGGRLRMADPSERMDTALRVRHTGLFRYNFGVNQYEPDLAESYAWSNDNKTLTIKLRKGLKWSDGTPFTTADMMFIWEKVYNHPEVSPAGPPAFWKPGGVPAQWQVIDDYTISFTWAEPYPIAMDRFGRTHFSGDNELFLPAHYLKQFHKDFNPDVDKLAQEQGFNTWVDLFNARRAQGYQAPSWPLDRPTMDSWVPKQIESNRIVLERNPYFHQVDPAGNQLPYIDYVEINLVSNPEVLALKLTSGELDFEPRFTAADKLPLYRQNEATGNYKTYIAQFLEPSTYTVFFNQTVKDEQLHALFTDLRFREALSNAINRDEINEILFFNLGEIHPPTPLKTMPWFDPTWYEKEYLRYDVDRANSLLDELGLTRRDNEQYRLLPDGRRLSIILEWSLAAGGQATAKFCELLIADWKAVGVEASCVEEQPDIVTERMLANEYQAIIWALGRATLLGRGTPDNWAFEDPSRHNWAPQWAIWNSTGGKEGIEPPQEVKDQIALWTRFKQVPSDSPEAVELGRKYFGWFADNLWFIPTVGLSPQPIIVHNRLRNVPTEGLTWSSDHNFYAPFHMEQFYIEE